MDDPRWSADPTLDLEEWEALVAEYDRKVQAICLYHWAFCRPVLR